MEELFKQTQAKDSYKLKLQLQIKLQGINDEPAPSYSESTSKGMWHLCDIKGILPQIDPIPQFEVHSFINKKVISTSKRHFKLDENFERFPLLMVEI